MWRGDDGGGWDGGDDFPEDPWGDSEDNGFEGDELDEVIEHLVHAYGLDELRRRIEERGGQSRR